MKNEYEELFNNFLDLTEFTLVKYADGWGLIDYQAGNLGGIEGERFENAKQLIDRMDGYISDYLVKPITDCLDVLDIDDTYINWGMLAEELKGKAGESEADVLMLDAICNHPDEIDLINCDWIMPVCEKKNNMAYWDEIDEEAEMYVKNIAAFSYVPIDLDEEDVLEIGKEITQIAIEALKAHGGKFPYVDTNY